jgi:hypothetical protein
LATLDGIIIKELMKWNTCFARHNFYQL